MNRSPIIALAVFVASVACESSPSTHRTTHVPVTKPRYNSNYEPPTELRGFMLSNGAPAQNGAQAVNGFMLSNRLMLSNGFMLSNGLVEVGGMVYFHRDLGLDVDHSLSSELGLSSQYGYVPNTTGRIFLKYLVECALGPNDFIHKGGHTFGGQLGLAPEWKTSACGTDCQEWVTACLLARTNAQGQPVMIELRATHPAIHLTVADPAFSLNEGSFWGNVFAQHPTAYTCQGPDLELAKAKNRLCAAGECAGINLVDYRVCTDACATQDGVPTSCPNSSWMGAMTSSAVITTFARP